MRSNIQARKVKLEDARLLWIWANDPSVRQFSFSKDPIDYNSHLTWLQDKINSRGTSFWIIEKDNQPVGQVRYERTGLDSAEIHFSVACDYRGQGVGTLALQKTEELATDELGVYKLSAVVFANNSASQRVFEKCRYELMEESEVRGIACLRYYKELGSKNGQGAYDEE